MIAILTGVRFSNILKCVEESTNSLITQMIQKGPPELNVFSVIGDSYIAMSYINI